MELRWYQRDAVDAAMESWEKGFSPVVVLPTGAGKSPLQGELARFAKERKKSILFLAHRAELIRQNAEACVQFGVSPAIYSASLGMRRMGGCVVAQMQSFARIAKRSAFDFLVIDEAHLVPHKEGTQYRKIIDALKTNNANLRILGLTATPYRLQGGPITAGEGKIFDHVCFEAPVLRLVQEGYLSPVVTRATESINLDGVRTVGGEYDAREQEARAMDPHLTARVVGDVTDALVSRRCALVYGVSVAHAEHLRDAMRAAGHTSECVTGETPNRESIIDRFKSGAIRVLVSCDVLTTGFNHPPTDIIALVRATQSTSLYVQIIGRGMRVADGKRDCLVLDYGKNIERHGPIDEVRVKPKKKKAEGEQSAPTKICQHCYGEIHAACRVCPFCDMEQPAPEKPKAMSTKASKLAILSTQKIESLTAFGIRTQAKPDDVEIVTHFEVSKYRKSFDATPTLCIEYFGARKKSAIAKEWLAPEHHTTARNKFVHIWREIETQCGIKLASPPATVDDAVAAMSGDDLRCVAIEVDKSGEYPQVKKRYWRLNEDQE